MSLDPDGPIDLFKTLWALAKVGAIVMAIAWGFLACTGQLPVDPS